MQNCGNCRWQIIGRARGYVDDGFDKLKPLIDSALAESPVLSLAMHDCVDNAVNLRHVVDYLKKQNARFVTSGTFITARVIVRSSGPRFWVPDESNPSYLEGRGKFCLNQR